MFYRKIRVTGLEKKIHSCYTNCLKKSKTFRTTLGYPMLLSFQITLK